MDRTLSECDLSQNITRNSLILKNIRIAAHRPFYTTGIVDKIFKEIARIVAPETLEEALTESDEDKAEDGGEAEERDEIEAEDERPKIEGGAFADTVTDSKHGSGALTVNAESVRQTEIARATGRLISTFTRLLLLWPKAVWMKRG